MAIWGGILAGGASRRMGHPKQLLTYRGASFTALAHAALAPHCDRVVVLGEGGALPVDVPALERVADAAGIHGPMAGILGALLAQPTATWLICACDMPLITQDEVSWLLQSHAAGGRAATMPWVDDRPLPTFALYTPAIAPAVQALAASGKGPIGLGHRDDVHTAAPPRPERLVNVNTPAELAALNGAD